MSKRTKLWLQGIAAAAISGAASSVSVLIVDPLTFNPFVGGQWAKLGSVSLVSALIGVALYFKQSPLPMK